MTSGDRFKWGRRITSSYSAKTASDTQSCTSPERASISTAAGKALWLEQRGNKNVGVDNDPNHWPD